jgi:hypothetical protein
VEAFTAVLPVEALEVGVFAVVLTLLAFAAAFVVMAFAEVAFAAVGSTIAASTIGSSSLVILVTRSFTIPIHTTDTIPIAIILMVTDTAAFAAAAFVVAGLVAAAFAAVAFVAVAFAAVGDPYNRPVYQGSAGYTDQLVEQIQLRLARAGYYGLELRIAERFGFGASRGQRCQVTDLAQSYSQEGGLLSPARRGEVDPRVLFSKTGNKSGTAAVVLMNATVHNQSRSLVPQSGR